MALEEFNHFFKDDYYQESKLSSSKRNDLDDSDFALVYTDENGKKIRKYPIHDEAHVKAAAKMFPRGVPLKYKKKVAHKILRKAHEFDIDTSGWNSVNAYQESFIDEQLNDLEWYDESVKEEYQKMTEGKSTLNKILFMLPRMVSAIIKSLLRSNNSSTNKNMVTPKEVKVKNKSLCGKLIKTSLITGGVVGLAVLDDSLRKQPGGNVKEQFINLLNFKNNKAMEKESSANFAEIASIKKEYNEKAKIPKNFYFRVDEDGSVNYVCIEGSDIFKDFIEKYVAAIYVAIPKLYNAINDAIKYVNNNKSTNPELLFVKKYNEIVKDVLKEYCEKIINIAQNYSKSYDKIDAKENEGKLKFIKITTVRNEFKTIKDRMADEIDKISAKYENNQRSLNINKSQTMIMNVEGKIYQMDDRIISFMKHMFDRINDINYAFESEVQKVVRWANADRIKSTTVANEENELFKIIKKYYENKLDSNKYDSPTGKIKGYPFLQTRTFYVDFVEGGSERPRDNNVFDPTKDKHPSSGLNPDSIEGDSLNVVKAINNDYIFIGYWVNKQLVKRKINKVKMPCSENGTREEEYDEYYVDFKHRRMNHTCGYFFKISEIYEKGLPIITKEMCENIYLKYQKRHWRDKSNVDQHEYVNATEIDCVKNDLFKDISNNINDYIPDAVNAKNKFNSKLKKVDDAIPKDKEK